MQHIHGGYTSRDLGYFLYATRHDAWAAPTADSPHIFPTTGLVAWYHMESAIAGRLQWLVGWRLRGTINAAVV